ncbi:hypothetical protein ACQY0O_001091 [Thecaphora frezii]
MYGSTPLMMRPVRTKRDDSSGCAVCATIDPCPVCKKGYQCQQIFRTSCQTCPTNKCVAIEGAGSESGNKSASLGGALGGVLAAVAIAAVVFFFWRRTRRRRIALSDEARRRSELAAQEKRVAEKGGVTLQLGGAKGGQPEILDNDTEWTQMEGNPLDDRLDPAQLHAPFKRRSFGAATHLSKITEGAEEEEDDDEQRRRQQPGVGGAGGHMRDSSRSSSINVGGAGPRVSIGSGTTFSSKNIIPITFRAPPASPTGPGSKPPSPVPQSPQSGSPVEATRHSQQPMRPVRSPHLNLRLADGAEPGQRSKPQSPGAASQLSPLSSAGGSSNAMLSPHSAALPANGRKLSFMSLDPAAALQQSRVYRQSDRRLSTATVNTMASTSTAGLDYVLSAPQIITPVTADGARRVQVNKGGKAQLVRGSSLKRKDGEASRDTSPASTPTAMEHADPFTDAAAAAAAAYGPGLQPFDAQSAHKSHLSTMSTSTLGIPFADEVSALQDPKGTSPVDADRSSWLGMRISLATSRGREDDERDGHGHRSTHSDESRRSPFSDEAAVPPLPERVPALAQASSTTTTGPDERHASLTESIGGLSVFDHFPIAFGSEPLPSDAQTKLTSLAKQAGSSGSSRHAEGGEEEEEEEEEHVDDSGLVTPRAT